MFGKKQSSFPGACRIVFQARVVFFDLQLDVYSLAIEERKHSRGEAGFVPYESLIPDQSRSDTAYDPLDALCSVRLDSLGIGCFDHALFYQSADHAKQIVDN